MSNRSPPPDFAGQAKAISHFLETKPGTKLVSAECSFNRWSSFVRERFVTLFMNKNCFELVKLYAQNDPLKPYAGDLANDNDPVENTVDPLLDEQAYLNAAVAEETSRLDRDKDYKFRCLDFEFNRKIRHNPATINAQGIATNAEDLRVLHEINLEKQQYQDDRDFHVQELSEPGNTFVASKKTEFLNVNSKRQGPLNSLNEKVSKAIGVFISNLDAALLQKIQPHLVDGRVRRAFYIIDQHFAMPADISAERRQAAGAKIYDYVYTKAHSMESNIAYFRGLVKIYDAINPAAVMSEKDYTKIFVTAVTKGDCHPSIKEQARAYSMRFIASTVWPTWDEVKNGFINFYDQLLNENKIKPADIHVYASKSRTASQVSASPSVAIAKTVAVAVPKTAGARSAKRIREAGSPAAAPGDKSSFKCFWCQGDHKASACPNFECEHNVDDCCVGKYCTDCKQTLRDCYDSRKKIKTSGAIATSEARTYKTTDSQYSDRPLKASSLDVTLSAIATIDGQNRVNILDAIDGLSHPGTELIRPKSESARRSELERSANLSHIPYDTSKFRIILDSGASDHMLPTSSLLSNVRPTSGLVRLADKNVPLQITGRGDTPMLSDVLIVPNLSFGLISQARLDKAGCHTVISGRRARIYNPNGDLLFVARLNLRANLYFLEPHDISKCTNSGLMAPTDSPSGCTVHETISSVANISVCNLRESCITTLASASAATRPHQISLDQDVRGSAPFRPISKVQGYNELEVLHHRWGHASEQALKSAIFSQAVNGSGVTYDLIKNQHIRYCEHCKLGKMSTPPSTVKRSREWAVLEKICVDYKGPFPTKTVYGHTGFYLFVDQQSSFTKAYLVKSKNELSSCLQDFLSSVVTVRGWKWKVLQTDTDSVAMKSAIQLWLTESQIRLQLSAPYKHSQNGKVERQMRTILDISRSTMAAYDAPKNLWGYAIEHACYTYNCTHVNRRTGKTPYESVFREKPDVSHLVPFYAPGVFHLSDDERARAGRGKTYKYKAEPVRMLGYSDVSKNTYKVLLIRSKFVAERTDCYFNEDLCERINNSNKHPDLKAVLDYMSKTNEDIQHLQEELSSPSNSSSDSPVPSAVEDATITSDAPTSAPEVTFPKHLSHYDVLKDPGKDSSPSDDEAETDVEFDTDSISGEEFANFHSAISSCLPGEMPYVEDNSESNDYIIHDDSDYDNWWCNVACLSQANLPPLPDAPQTIQQATDPSNPDRDIWLKAIKNEMSNMGESKVFGAAPQSGRGMKMKWVFRVLWDNEFKLKYKARLVCCGYSQIYGQDYKDTYSPTPSVIAQNLSMHVAAHKRLLIAAFDVKAAFLEAFNDFQNFAWLPPGTCDKPIRVELVKAQYGEKQAPKLWYERMNQIMTKLGFKRCPTAPCLYSRISGDEYSICSIHVDDGFLCTNLPTVFEEFISGMKKEVRFASLTDPLKKYTGMEIEYDQIAGKIRLGMKMHIDQLPIPSTARSEQIPMSVTTNLRVEPPNPANPSLLPITGKTRFIVDRVRWDGLCTAGELSSHSANTPSDLAVKTADKMINYFSSSKDKYLSLGGGKSIDLLAFSDASYNTSGKAKSRLGGCLFAGHDSGAVYAYSKNAANIAASSTHAEVMGVDLMARIVEYSRQILDFLGCTQSRPTPIYVDNKSAIQLCDTLKSSHITSSINMRRQYLRELINRKVISLHFVPSDDNVADVLTKPLPISKHLSHSDKLLGGFQNIPVDNNSTALSVIDSTFDWSTLPTRSGCTCCYDFPVFNDSFCHDCYICDC